MSLNICRVARCSLAVLLATASAAWAAGQDVRLVTAAAEQDKATIRALLKKGVDVNARRADGATALLWAAHWTDLETVDLLLKAGANVNAADDHGVTPLARAAENGSEAMTAKLLAARADAAVAQTNGLTPLMIAARTGNTNVVKLLLAHGANVNATTNESKVSALMYAIAEPHPGIVKVLIEGGADVRLSSARGYTPLMFAARNGDIEMAKALIAAGVQVNELASDGTHVLPYSVVLGQGDFALFLLEQGADANGAMDGVRPLHAAAGGFNVNTWLGDWFRRHGDNGLFGGAFVSGGRGIDGARRTQVVKALIGQGGDVNARISTSAMFMSYIGYPKKGAFEPYSCGTGDIMGATPLWLAAYAANGSVGGFGGDGDRVGAAMRGESSTDVIKALLEAGADVHAATDDGTTPLMAAAGLGRATFDPGLKRGRRSVGAEEAVNVLLDAGARINDGNEADFTALHGAAFRGLNEVIKILVDRGADINARDFRGRTAYRIAEGAKQSFQFQAYPETAEFVKSLGANTRLGIPGTIHERLRDVGAAVGAATNEQP
jgi:ankyrin repeat protein